MNKFYIYLSSIILILFLGIQFWNVYTTPDSSEYQEICLLNINPNYNDFSRLDSALSNKRIIMLGESLHYDGSTFTVKSKLIQYLHKKFGYDVVLFEAGFYDMERLNRAESKIKPTNFLYPFWGDVKQTNELWEYLDENRSISLGGFDVQPTGNLADSSRGATFRDYLKECDISIENHRLFAEIIDNVSKYRIGTYKYTISDTKKDSIISDINNVYRKLILSEKDSLDNRLYSTYLKNLKDLYSYIWHYDNNHERRFHLRDSLMADNLIWQIENNYKDRKIIIWAANLHIIHDNNGYKDKIPFTTMGEYIKDKYRDSCYTLVFSSYCSENEEGKIYSTGSSKSLEYFLHELGYKAAFIDFSKLPNEYITLRANQNMNLQGKWTTMIDGLFYIDTMKPIDFNDDDDN